jgi:hypothetical protein
MATTFYDSDASAPTLTSSAGSFIALLDACLVTGYGSKTGLGWTKDYSGTNVAVYRAPGGNRHYIRVDDTDTQVVRVVGFESMTGLSTGFNQFPTDAQVSGGLYLRKTSGGTSGWILAGNDRCFYFFPEVGNAWAAGSTTGSSCGQFFFGDFISYRSGDQFNTMIIGSTSSTAGMGNFAQLNSSGSPAAGHLGHYICRGILQLKRSIGCYKSAMRYLASNNYSDFALGVWNGFVTSYPDPVSGMITMQRIQISERGLQQNPNLATDIIVARGYLPGLWAPQQTGFNHGDTFNGTASQTYLVVTAYTRNNALTTTVTGKAFLETSNTW